MFTSKLYTEMVSLNRNRGNHTIHGDDLPPRAADFPVGSDALEKKKRGKERKERRGKKSGRFIAPFLLLKSRL